MDLAEAGTSSAKQNERDYQGAHGQKQCHIRKMGLLVIEGLRKRAATSQKSSHMSKL